MIPIRGMMGVGILLAMTSQVDAQTVDKVVGVHGVSPNGAATYTIPLREFVGPGGLNIPLSLVYSSQGDNGLLGPGWSLSGIASSISRCAATLATNGTPSPVENVPNDRYCLDGNQLLLQSGTYAQDGSTYRTEIDTFGKIAAVGTTGTGPQSFTVHSKDGRIYSYGRTTDSRTPIYPASTIAKAWKLDKIADRNGNALTILYQNGTATGVSTADNWIPLGFSYTGGKLSRINYVFPQSYYDLEYSTSPSTGVKRLKSIAICSGVVPCGPPTTVSYQDGQIGLQTTAVSVASGTILDVRPVDVDGDGKEEIIYAMQDGANWRWRIKFSSGTLVDPGLLTPSSNGVLLVDDFLATGAAQFLAFNGTSWAAYQWNGSALSAVTLSLAADSYPSTQVVTPDIDGDGRADLVWLEASGSIHSRLNQSTASAIQFGSKVTTALDSPIGDPSTQWQLMRPIDNVQPDFDGDGREDVAAIFSASYWNIDENCFANTGSVEQCMYQAFNMYSAQLNSRTGGYSVSYAEGAPNFNTTMYFQSVDWDGSGSRGAAYATQTYVDWDHDGAVDVLQDYGTALKWIKHADAAANNWGSSYQNSTGITYSGVGTWIVFDHDGDGQYDLIRRSASGLSLYLHNSVGVHTDVASTISDGYGIAATFAYASTSLASYSRTWSGVSAPVYPVREQTRPRYVVNLVTASDGTGNTFQEPLAYAVNREELRGRKSSGFVIRQSQDSRTGFYSVEARQTKFPFAGLVTGLAVYRANYSTLVSTTTQTPIANPLTAINTYFPRVASSITQRYEYQIGGAQDGQLIDTRTTSFLFDDYGNLTNVTENMTDNDVDSAWNGQVWQSVTINTMSLDLANWCIGLPTMTTVTRTLPGGSSQISKTGGAVDSAKCRYTQRTLEPDSSALRAAVDLTYHTCGRLETETVNGRHANGNNLTSRQTSYGYSEPYLNSNVLCESTTSITNALGQQAKSERYVHETFWMADRIVDRNGLISYRINEIAKPSKEIGPDGRARTWTYTLCNLANNYCGSGLTDVRVRSEQVEDNDQVVGATAYTSRMIWFDGLQRVRRLGTPSATGVCSSTAMTGCNYVDTTYNGMGQVWKVTSPFSVSSTGLTRYTYSLGRIATMELVTSGNTVDRTSSIHYAGRHITVTDAKNYVTYKTYDVTGALRAVQDPSPGGTTTYDYYYDANNNRIDTVTDPALNPVTVTTNVRGFKISQTDTNMGNLVFAYNSLGELESQTDGANQTIDYQYDTLGRVVQRTEAEGNTIFTWGASANDKNVGQIAGVTSPGNYSESHEYDAFAREKIVKYNYTGEGEFRFDFGYDGLGQLKTLTYPESVGSRFAAEYSYVNGHRTEVKEQGAQNNFWTLNASDQHHFPIDEMLGNGVHIISGFDPLTSEMNYRQYGNNSSTSNLRDFWYTWDKNGNLESRHSAGQLLTETFSYDPLNRIIQSSVTGQSPVSFAYNSIGNMTSRTDVSSGATWTYDSNKKHAVTSIGPGSSYNYDADGNMTSRNGGNISWTSYNYPKLICSGAISNGVCTSATYSDFSYGAHRNRWRQVANYGGATETTIYAGGLFEKVTVSGSSMYRHLLRAGSTTISYQRNATTTVVTYIATDHLGSSATYTGGSGSLIANTNFDAFGKRRDPADWNGPPPNSDLQAIANALRNGFTGHEHLDNMTLIHMNGRVYDPAIGRFISADPYTTDPDFSQGLNRYSYVLNNPLKYLDPSGFECVWIDFPTRFATGTLLGVPVSSPHSTVECNPPDREPDLDPNAPGAGPGSGGPAPPAPPAPPDRKPLEHTCTQVDANLVRMGNALQRTAAFLSDRSSPLLIVGGSTLIVGLLTAQPEIAAPGLFVMALGGAGSLLADASQTLGGALQGMGSSGFGNMYAGGSMLLTGAGLARTLTGPLEAGYRTVSQRRGDAAKQIGAGLAGGTYDLGQNVFDALAPSEKTPCVPGAKVPLWGSN